MNSKDYGRLKYYHAVIAAVLIASIGILLAIDEEESRGDFTLPVMEIGTHNGDPVVSKVDYLDCEISVSNTDPGFILDGEKGGIRGRGNSTWDQPSYWKMPKKSYKIKFDSEVDLFGNGAAREWNLIANYTDPSLSRNFVAYSVGRAVGLEYTTSTQCANLYLNGVYQGEYLVCEQVEVGPGRVEIDPDLEKEGFGFLVVMDGWIMSEGQEGRDYFLADGICYQYKHPSPEDGVSAEKFGYVRDYVREAFDAVKSGDYGLVSQYVDTDSFARTYVVNEMFNTKDLNAGSFYLYKDAGGKLASGPLWDFDRSSGNGTDIRNKDPDYLWAADVNPWYSRLVGYGGFREAVRDVIEDRGAAIREALHDDMGYLKAHEYDFNHNFTKWPILGSLTDSNPLEFLLLRSWSDHLEYLEDWLEESLDHMAYEYGERDGDNGDLPDEDDDDEDVPDIDDDDSDRCARRSSIDRFI